MLVALGFLTAGFITLLLMPFYRHRAERLAVEAVKASLPMSEAEMRADKDRLRAEYAIRIHQLESKVEDASHQSARQRIELNRRDGAINGLESELATLRISLEEHENARRVLEQTITERLPKVEQRLAEARTLLTDRDREIERLTNSADTTGRALEEARQINMQQKDELHRLNATLTTRQVRNRDELADPRFDAEVALRAELEAIRARSREQAETIARLQVAASRERDAAAVRANGFGPPPPPGAEVMREQKIERLRASLAEAEIALKSSQSSGDVEASAAKAMQREIDTLKSRNQLLDAELENVKASLRAYEAARSADTDGSESKVALKARIGALEQAAQSQTVTVQGLRAELAAANERLARQATYFRDELKRLGTGTQPASTEPRNRSLERHATPPPSEMPQRRKTLAERIGAPRAVAVSQEASPPASAEEQVRVGTYLKALAGGGAVSADGLSLDAAMAAEPAAGGDAAEAGEPRRRSSLLDRITNAGTNAGKTSGN